MFKLSCKEEIKEADPKPVTVEANSTGSMKVVM
jgi:hypothetical protein